jgi:hypothetical protein
LEVEVSLDVGRWCLVLLAIHGVLQTNFPVFHHSTIPPFHHSTIPSFRHSIFPPSHWGQIKPPPGPDNQKLSQVTVNKAK